MRRRLGILEHNLSKRQAQILRAVVEAYVEGAGRLEIYRSNPDAELFACNDTQ